MKGPILLTILASALFSLNISAQKLSDNTIPNAAVLPGEAKSKNKQTGKEDFTTTDSANIKISLPAAPQTPQAAGTCDLGGNIEVEATAGTNTAYATLGAAFTAINAGTHTGAITIDVCGDTTETAAAVLNASGVGAASYTTIVMSPAGGAARTISGAIAAGNPLLDLNGADNVTINGLNTGGNALTISNTTIGTTAGSATVRFIADATTNTITNTTILGSSLTTLATAGGTVLFSTGTTTGNDANTISNCNIGPAGANLPSKAIMASGTSSAIENDNVLITGNNIFDFFNPAASNTGINVLTGNEGWTVSNNKFYQTAARTFTTTALRYSAITLNNSTGSFNVSGNTIGFAAANGTGTTTISGSSNEVRGIDAASVFTTAPTTISNNIITGISQSTSRASTTTASSAFIAVAMGTTDGLINATGNTVGSLDGSSTIVVTSTATTASTAPVVGFYNFSFFNTNISNNTVGSITINGTGTVIGFRGILVNTGTALTATVNNNTIANITDTQVGSYAMYGIQSALPAPTITGNIIRNFTGASNGASLIIAGGILVSGNTAAATISQNRIFGLTNTSGAAANSIYAMSLTLPTAANIVSRNLIYGLSLTSTATGTQLWGISGGATGTTVYQNNMIRLGTDALGNSVTQPSSIVGIRDAAGSTNNYYNNSVFISGTGVLATPAASNSYCFLSSVTTGTRNVLDNIFFNARSNAVAGGIAHLAIGISTTTTGLTSNYNDLYVTGTDGNVGVFNATVYPTLAAYQTATGLEANSFSVNPQFVSTVDLHLTPTSPMINAGTVTPFTSNPEPSVVAAVADDFDGQARDAQPDIGADEYLMVTAAPASISGRVISNGKGLANAKVELTGTGGQTRTVSTNSLGGFTFTSVDSGATYVVNVSAKRYTFAPQVVSLTENVSDLIFTAQ